MDEHEPAPPEGAAETFPGTVGECAALVRSHNWSATPLDEIDRWPAPLKTLVPLILASRQPMFVCWGPERTLIYNDAYAEILVTKHPTAMGRDFLAVWHEIRESLEPLVEHVLRGEALFMDDIALMMQRKGYLEQAHFSFSYTPIRDEAAKIGGFYCACDEITDQVVHKKFSALRTELLEQLRGLDKAEDLFVKASETLGPPLDAAAVAFAEIDEKGGRFTVSGSWSADDLSSLDGDHAIADLGPYLALAATQDEALAITDLASDVQDAGFGERFVPYATGSLLAAPLHAPRERSLALLVFSREPRRWTEAEIEFALQKVERLKPLLERARADQALREERTFLRTVIETAPIGISIARDPLGLPPILNETAREMTGVGEPPHGEQRYSLFTAAKANGEPYDLEDYPTLRALKNGEEIDEEPMTYIRNGQKRRWLVNSRPIFAENGDIAAAVTAFVDVEQQLRSEEQVRLVNKELNHRVKNLFAVVQSLVSLSAREETDAEELATKLNARISALAQAHSVGMSEEPHHEVNLQDMLSAILSPYGRTERHLDLTGPDILLPPHMITPLGLILHELATNAVKYGAWSESGGRLAITWAFEDDGTVVLSWEERCLNARDCRDRPLGLGFGTQLMKGAAKQIGGSVEQRFGPAGLHTTVAIRMDRSR